MGERGRNARPLNPESYPEGRPWQDEQLELWRRVQLFIEGELQITSGIDAGKPFLLRPWQLEWLTEIYRTEEGRRIVRTAVLSVARKNGKSALIAALGLVHVIGPCREPRGQIVIGATDRDQAHVIFGEVAAQIEASGWMRDVLNIQVSAKRIESAMDGSEIQALSSDARKAHGLSPTLVILDELAQWGQGVGVRLYDALMTAGGARKDPLKIIISTQAGDDLSKMSKLLDDGLRADDPRTWCRLYMVPEEFDPFDESKWYLANPALDDFRTLEDMRELADRAKRMPSERAVFENLFLNRRVRADERWIDQPTWMACHGEVDPEALKGQLCFGGLDLASVSDLTSFCLFFPESGAVLSWNWLPAARIAERSERDGVPYDIWHEDGWLELTPGKATSKKAVVRRLCELNRAYRPREIAYDRYGMKEIAQILEEEGIDDLPLVEHGQGVVSMSPSMKATEAKILNGALVHDNPVLTWSVANVRVTRDDADGVKPSKSKSRDKIDPIVAMIMAVGTAVQHMAAPDDRAFRAEDVAAALGEVEPLVPFRHKAA
jgi:phage terminase large subunit-like protein